jgi:hypothetical protein
MKNEIQMINDAGYTNVARIASFLDDNSIKNMYIAKFKDYRFVTVDRDMSDNKVFVTGEVFKDKQSIMAKAYDFLINSWGFKDNEISEDVKQANILSKIGFNVTKEELGALQYACDCFSDINQSEMAEINAFYLNKLIKKIEKII